jgi:hypothetical protein
MRYSFAAAILALGTSGAFAQMTPANQNGHTPAVATTGTVNPDAPVAGKNSFTESQAKSRIEAAGFTGVSGLNKDNDGVWHGKASKAGTTQTVNLDFQGNVTAN